MMLEKFKKPIEWATMSMAIIIPLFTLPQLLKIWLEKSAEGVSIMTWSVYCISTITWLLYGLLHNDKKLL